MDGTRVYTEISLDSKPVRKRIKAPQRHREIEVWKRAEANDFVKWMEEYGKQRD